MCPSNEEIVYDVLRGFSFFEGRVRTETVEEGIKGEVKDEVSHILIRTSGVPTQPLVGETLLHYERRHVFRRRGPDPEKAGRGRPDLARGRS